MKTWIEQLQEQQEKVSGVKPATGIVFANQDGKIDVVDTSPRRGSVFVSATAKGLQSEKPKSLKKVKP